MWTGFDAAFLQSGKLAAAAKEYEEFLGINSLGGERQEPWTFAHYQLGRIYEQKGQPKKAAGHYQFLNIWKEADGDPAALKDARQRLAALKRPAAEG